jgi:hypothetical protein
MLHRRPHAEIWSAREGSDDDTSKIHLSNKPLTDPKQCQQRTKGPLQKPNSVAHPHLKPWSISDTTKLSKKNHNHMTTTELHLRNQPLTELNLNTPHVHLVSDAASVTNGWQHPTTSEHQNKTWTKHRCSSLDPITHPIRNRRLRQILTARILRRRKSRRRNGKP